VELCQQFDSLIADALAYLQQHVTMAQLDPRLHT
jgi:hypothetical protein